MGNKKKLINKGLINLFPKDIDIFYDLCGGSAIVSMNTQANLYVVNDIKPHLFALYNLFKTQKSEKIITHIEKRINAYGLAKERTKRNQYNNIDKLKKYKNAYIAFRKFYNDNLTDEITHILDFYTLTFYSFSQQFRFNTKEQFNMPVGNDCFSDMNKQYIQNGCNFFSQSNVHISHFDLINLPIDKLTSSDFVYLDPPYLNTTATYNENNGWNISDELKLYVFCEKLNKSGIRWSLSNIFMNKGKENSNLIKWCKDKNWNVYTFDKFTYMACGKGNSQAKEVYICNY